MQLFSKPHGSVLLYHVTLFHPIMCYSLNQPSNYICLHICTSVCVPISIFLRMQVFWDVTWCCWLSGSQHFEGLCSLSSPRDKQLKKNFSWPARPLWPSTVRTSNLAIPIHICISFFLCHLFLLCVLIHPVLA
jgi:hypothetical protein